jgi:predicted O-methyltransferase YrrM
MTAVSLLDLCNACVLGVVPPFVRSQYGPQMPKDAISTWVDAWPADDPHISTARLRATEVGVQSVDATTGSLLRVLMAASRAKAVVELGTGAGVSGLWLLGGMPGDGILTSIDSESEHQRLAKQSLTDAGYSTARARLINGRALEVLPKLSDGAYDVLFCDASREENLEYLESGVRLLRPGGLLLFAAATADGRVADPGARDPDAVAMRDLLRVVKEREDLMPALLPVSSGLLAAVVREG